MTEVIDANLTPAGRQRADGSAVVSIAVRALVADAALRRSASHKFLCAISDIVDDLRRGDADTYNDNPARDPRLNRDDLLWFVCLMVCGLSPQALFEKARPFCPADDGDLDLLPPRQPTAR